MTAGRRMKLEMTLAQRKRKQAKTPGISKNDRAELAKFAAYLKDGDLPLIERIDKHTADYLGFKPDEVEAIRAAASLAKETTNE